MTVSSAITKARRVVFQGEPGSYSHLACREALPHCEAVAAPTFEDAFAAIRGGTVDLGLIPIENSLHGRIADIHHLLPDAPIYILGEHFLRVRHQLLGVEGATISSIKTVVSQEPALGQCRKIVQELGLKRQLWADTAGAARHVAVLKDKTVAAIASSLAAEIHKLTILRDRGTPTKIFKELVAKQPNHSTYHFHLGMAYNQKGDKTRALEQCREALKFNPAKEEKDKIERLITMLG